MKSLLRALSAVVLLCASTSAHAGDTEGAKRFIDNVGHQVLDVLKTDAAKPEKQAKLETIFSSKVDISFVAKFVLGQHWRTATPEQQKAYVEAYGPFVIGNYANKLTRYSGQNYALKNSRQDGDGSFLVTMTILDGSSADAQVDYRLRAAGANYQLVDIIVEGVSLLATQRSEFNAIVQNKGIDHLIAQLKSSAEALHKA
jgi:phospholipid transport system substrate-binding protein